MNKIRRNQVGEALEKLQELQDEIRVLLEEEEDYMNNIPENLQGSSRYEISEQAVENLQSAVDSIDEAISSLEESVAE